MIKHGFLIRDNKIYDTQIKSYKLVVDYCGDNIIHRMVENGYKRLFLFDFLLDKYDIEYVFKILKFNKQLKKNRLSEKLRKNDKLHYMSNMSIIYSYPPTYLTQKKFALYKICQNLKKRID